MYELKKIGKVVTIKFIGTGSSSYKKIIYRAAVSQKLRNADLDDIGGGVLGKIYGIGNIQNNNNYYYYYIL